MSPVANEVRETDAKRPRRSRRGRRTPGGPRRRRWRPRPLQAVGPADDVEHDLVRTRADAVQPHVAPDAFDPVLLHVARTAMDLDALVGDLDGDARREQLRLGDLAHRVLAV